jgi:hypothetical protein
MVAMKRCPHLGCRLAGMKMCCCFGSKVPLPLVYVVWRTAHPERPWSVGHETRPGYLRVVALAESRRLADLLAERLTAGDY